MKRKPTIAAGIIHRPKILFLDEPTTGIDVASARQLRKLIDDLHCTGTTIFLTTHYIEGFLYQQLMVGSQHSIVDIPDITGMANALEYRSPFLDVKMMELAMRIPAGLKVRSNDDSTRSKWILSVGPYGGQNAA